MAYLYTMELTYKELKKRDVINVVDGKCLGQITDLTLVFPSGKLVGITVPGKKSCKLLNIFNRNPLYIEVNKITKIGNDVILVNLQCMDVCSPSSPVEKPRPPRPPHHAHSQPPTCEQLFSNDCDDEEY